MSPPLRLEELQPLAWAVWKNAEKAKADNGESVRRWGLAIKLMGIKLSLPLCY